MDKTNFLRVPLAGNAYAADPDRAPELFPHYRHGVGLVPKPRYGLVFRDGIVGWDSPEASFEIYLKLKNAASFDAALLLKPQRGEAVLSLSACGVTYEATAETGETELPFGIFNVPAGGYLRFTLRGLSRKGEVYAEPTDLILYGISAEDVDAYVGPEDHANYYWTRRGPSVHCGYAIGGHGDVEWFYNEVSVPEGYDLPGTYAMAIGFNGGYFGIQVNSKTERRILFSIWSPYQTDHPEEIPEEDRVICLGRHENTHVGEFGGEGSGGQSFMLYPWRGGTTYRFLMHVRPAPANRTEFTAYFFFPETGKFERIASFSRPKMQTYLTGAHSFLENFHDMRGHQTRMAYYGNQWARTKEGLWFAPAQIRFTGDTTARRGWRKDYAGGLAPDGRFFLRHCGFFDDNVPLDSVFTREPAQTPPWDEEPEPCRTGN